MMPVAPSSLAHPVSGQVVPKSLSAEEIQDIVEKFGRAALRVVEAGFDVISIHCAHMYLCGEFLSPWANQREDEYGGDLDGRMRFLREIISQVHKTVGNEVPIICRMNGKEPKGGNTPEEILEIAKRFQAAGVKGLHISVGFGASIKDPDFIPSITPMRAPDNCIVDLAARIKTVVSIPVIVVNKIKDVQAAESILQEGKADLVAMGRPLIADPELARKAHAGRFEAIRPCIYCCQGCAQNILEKDAPLACSTNPRAGREIEGVLEPAPKRKRVLILGAGPAGIQAAVTAASRGHHVRLVESRNEVGGQLTLAARPPGKSEISRFLTYLRNSLEELGIKVELGVKVNEAWLAQFKPDVAILATGSDPAIPNIKGLSTKNTVSGRDVLSGAQIRGESIVIIGGGQLGCEVGDYLASHGKKVSIVEILDDIAGDMPHISKLPLEMALEKGGVRIMTKTNVLSVTEEGVLVERKGSKEILPADVVVTATGATPHEEDTDRMIKEKVPEVHEIGDRRKGRTILDAVREGYDVGRCI
jgi:2,4-dienoyl-CoA reductase (NADPH2)